MVLFRLLRVKQYTKNVFVLAALFFTKQFMHPEPCLRTALAILVMCLVGSGTYIANDIVDAERDRAHPQKKDRPIASGLVSLPVGLSVAAVCLIAGLVLAYVAGLGVLYCALFYLAMQAAYNAGVKHVPIADVFVIAAGFVLRVVIGAVAIRVDLSGWILLCTGSLALLLGFGKRRHEFIEQSEFHWKSRESLKDYTIHTLDGLVVSSASIAILCYGLYGIESSTAKLYPGLIWTIPVVAFGIYRYMLLIFGNADTGEPETVVLRDRPLAVTFVLFIAVAAVAMSGRF